MGAVYDVILYFLRLLQGSWLDFMISWHKLFADALSSFQTHLSHVSLGGVAVVSRKLGLGIA